MMLHKRMNNMDNQTRSYLTSWQRIVTWPLAAIVLFASTPAIVLANNVDISTAQKLSAPPPPAMPPRVNKGPRKVTIFKPKLKFSQNPTDIDIESARVFVGPLVAMEGKHVPGENSALAKALFAFKAKKSSENTSDLKQFIKSYPNSRWRPSLELNLGLLANDTGYISQALMYFKSAYEGSKAAKTPQQDGVAEAALSNLVLLESRLGLKEELEANLAIADKRPEHGASSERVQEAHQGLWCMVRHPDCAYKCGPFAINSLLNRGKKVDTHSPLVEKMHSTVKGTNLAQVKQWADQAGLKYQLAKRVPGARIIVPSIMHWKVGHFAAIVASKNGKYQVKDPTFGVGGNLWITASAIDAETDGYFLIPTGVMLMGWKALSAAEATSVWGKGATSGPDPGKTPSNPKQCPGVDCGCGGMARASLFSLQASLNIQDTPLGYKPPIGPSIDFLVNYNYNENATPGSFTNLGENWSFNWCSHVYVSPSQNATVYVRGGGTETYNYTLPDNVSNPYPPNLTSQAVLTVVGDAVYQRQLPDGSIEVFSQPDGTGNFFMTQVVDPQGNYASITYDTNFRVTTITDAIGQASTVSYVSNTLGNSGFYIVSKITDPFSRYCTFTYDSTNSFLLSITDVINLTSQFIYDTSSSFITALTTPYGTTGFYKYNTNSYAGTNYGTGLRVSFPDGTSSIIENWIDEVSQTYFWDREATALYPSDAANGVHTHCKTTQWLLEGSSSPFTEAPVPDYVVPPLENKITYGYEGETTDGAHNFVGPNNKPITVTRNITGTTNQVWSYQYNAFGYATQSIDPVGRTFSYKYDANNIDLLEKRQTQGSNNDLNGKWEYNNTQHVPNKYIDGSGQATQYTYNSFGELQTLTDANSDVWTWTYNGSGYPTQKQGPLAGSNDVTTYSYDGYGRLYQVTDSEGYTVTYSYDSANRLTQTTYPDGTYEQIVYSNLDAVMRKDRIGRWTQRAYNSMDQPTNEIDPLSRRTQYAWCACGSLATLTDPAGHVTTWNHDLEGRIIEKTYADSTTVNYTYDTVGRLQTRLDALNQTTTYSYNLDNTTYQLVYTNAVNPTSTVTYTYDPNYVRLSTVQNGWGTITYTYNAYVTDPYATPTTGGGRLYSVANNVISNSTTTYTYDAIGRTTNRSINGSSNSTTWSYDAMSRVTSEANPLGTFNYAYVDDQSGYSKGTTRLASISYPNSQVTNFSYYGNVGDQRLQQITNLKSASSGVALSQFSYGYVSAGEITQWQQVQNGNNQNATYGYDLAGQLTSVQGGLTNLPPSYANQNYYAYDLASNLSGVQQSAKQAATIGGTVTTGDTLTITVSDSGLASPEAVTYTVQSGDTTTTIAANLAAAITADTNLQTIGVNAISNGTSVSIKSASPNITTYAQSTSVGATETITLGINTNTVELASVGGTKTTGDTITVTVHDPGLTGGTESVTYTVLSGDTLTTIASGISTAINADTSLSALGVTATASGQVLRITSTSTNTTTYTQSTSTGATETLTFSLSPNGNWNAMIGGSKTTSDTLTVTVYDAALGGGTEAVTYTVLSTDTLTTIASGIASAINADVNLQAIKVSATSSGQIVTLKSLSVNQTTYRATGSTSATETITAGVTTNGINTAAIGGSKTTGDTVTITVYALGLSGGSKAETYTVLSTDTLSTIATGLASVINGDSAMTAIGVSANAVSTVINLTSQWINATTYTQSTSGGATETITLGTSTAAMQYSYNNVNELTNIAAGGQVKYNAYTNKPLKSATVNSNAATLNYSENFYGNATLSPGNNTTTVSGTDGGNNTVTQTAQVSTKGPGSTTLTYDSNGNMTSDGTNTYVWDAENRLIQITYPGSGNNSQFSYDGNNLCVGIVETTSGSVSSTKQFVRYSSKIREARNVSGAIISQYFYRGETVSGSNYFYTKDQLGSTRELTNGSGIVQAQYLYDPYGQATTLQGSTNVDFQYAGYYYHVRSSLNLAFYREYNSKLGRWISRDPKEERGGVNLYRYVNNNPIEWKDSSGLLCTPRALPPLPPEIQIGPLTLLGPPPIYTPIDPIDPLPWGTLPNLFSYPSPPFMQIPLPDPNTGPQPLPPELLPPAKNPDGSDPTLEDDIRFYMHLR